jgi:hypothetical protein
MTESEARGVKLNAVIGSLVIFGFLILCIIGCWQTTASVGWHIGLTVVGFFVMVNLIKDLILIGEARIKTVKVNYGTSD